MSSAETTAEVARMLTARGAELDSIIARAGRTRDEGLARAGRPGVVTYSPKVFIPVTTLCRDRCHYCAFVDTPAKLTKKNLPPYMSENQVLAIAHQGARLGCTEALLTLGDRPEARWPTARQWLAQHGYTSTIEYIGHLAKRITAETGLLAHHNPGVMTKDELVHLRPTAPSMGMMLETTSRAVFDLPGGSHHGSPDKDPAVRLAVLEDAGLARVPFTTGLLIGIGESVTDRAESLLALRDVHARYGHLQEVIIQNFRAKPSTAMQTNNHAERDEYVAAIATARLILGAEMRIQAPPNLSEAGELSRLLSAGIDDWGGVSPLTADHVNPERPWPGLTVLRDATVAAGFDLQPRLTVHQEFIDRRDEWIDPALHEAVDTAALRLAGSAAPTASPARRPASASTDDLLVRAAADPAGLSDADYVRLMRVRGADLDHLCEVADGLRRSVAGATLSMVVNRNLSSDRVWDPTDVARVAADAWELGATELCVQGTPPASAPADVYEQIVAAVKRSVPELHLHAFRPADVIDGARRTGRDLRAHLITLRDAGLDTVTGTGAKILDEAHRARHFPEDVPIPVWIESITTAHEVGLRSTSVLVHGDRETSPQRITHLRTLREIQNCTGGFNEIVPMPFPGRVLDLDDTRAVHAVTRLMLHGSIDHIQAPWPRLDDEVVLTLLRSGADDLGGTLLDGRVLPEAGAEHGQEMPLDRARTIAGQLGRTLRLRSTTYAAVTT